MHKISITLDADKIKDLIQTREFTNKEGESVKVREIKLDVVPLKEQKFISQGDNWEMFKTHFIAKPQTKEEREQKAETVFVGDGIQFKNKGGGNDTLDSNWSSQKESTNTKPDYSQDSISPEDIPF